MNNPMINWSETPLFRAGIKVTNTPIKIAFKSPCGQWTLRFNVGNIHEIKKDKGFATTRLKLL